MNNRDRFRSVAEDLNHLTSDWMQDPPDPVVRRGSVILRRLLVEGVLQRAWKAFEFPREPRVQAPNLKLILGAKPEWVEVATAGGAQIGPAWAAGVILTRGSEPFDNPAMPDNALEFPFALSAFTESPSAYINGSFILRRELVKYFAHFEGGVHLHLSSRVRRAEQEFVRRVEAWRPRFILGGRDALYAELLAIGQCVGRSADLRCLVDRIEQHEPERAPGAP